MPLSGHSKPPKAGLSGEGHPYSTTHPHPHNSSILLKSRSKSIGLVTYPDTSSSVAESASPASWWALTIRAGVSTPSARSSLQRFDAGLAGHHRVEEEQVGGRLRAGGVHRVHDLLAVVGGLDLMALHFQPRLQQQEDGLGVVRDQHLRHQGASGSRM